MTKGRLLIVDDERSIRDVLTQVLGYDGYSVGAVPSGGEALAAYRERRFDLVLLDVKMRGIDGIDTLDQLTQIDPGAVVVMISGHSTISTAVQALKAGAFDFLEKPLDTDRLLVTVKNALEHGRLASENVRLREGLARATDSGSAMVGSSRSLGEIRAKVAQVAPTNARVLILGENGTGKELVARAIHDQSTRRAAPFIEVNCAAIPGELVESELFGHMKGSFTGAIADQLGRFELADGGTLFLDEIGDLGQAAQAKILRVLEEDELVRVGGNRAIPIDVRVIAATNRSLTGEIAAGRFREDLYHRLNVVPIMVPPLRDRRGDIPALVAHFVDRVGNGPGMTPKPFTEDALERLKQRYWAGNVRELRNAVERLLILTRGSAVTGDDITAILPGDLVPTVDPERFAHAQAHLTLHDFMATAEREYVQSKLKASSWNLAEASRALGLSRASLYRRMRELNIEEQPS